MLFTVCLFFCSSESFEKFGLPPEKKTRKKTLGRTPYCYAYCRRCVAATTAVAAVAAIVVVVADVVVLVVAAVVVVIDTVIVIVTAAIVVIAVVGTTPGTASGDFSSEVSSKILDANPDLYFSPFQPSPSPNAPIDPSSPGKHICPK